jgi:hypothetical protein
VTGTGQAQSPLLRANRTSRKLAITKFLPMTKKQAIFLKEKLTELHPDNEFYVISQIGYAAVQDFSTNMSDDTANLMTSPQYAALANY